MRLKINIRIRFLWSFILPCVIYTILITYRQNKVIDLVITEESKASFSLSQEIKNRLKEFDERLERLVDIFIDRQITQEEYAKRKSNLLNDKKDLEGKLKERENRWQVARTGKRLRNYL